MSTMCLFIFLASSFPLKQKFSEFKQFDHSPASLSLASLDLRLQRLQARPAVIAAVTQRPRLLLALLSWPLVTGLLYWSACISRQDAADTSTVKMSEISDKPCDNVIRHVNFLPWNKMHFLLLVKSKLCNENSCVGMFVQHINHYWGRSGVM